MTRPVRLLELVTFLARRAKTIREIAGRFEISERVRLFFVGGPRASASGPARAT